MSGRDREGIGTTLQRAHITVDGCPFFFLVQFVEFVCGVLNSASTCIGENREDQSEDEVRRFLRT